MIQTLTKPYPVNYQVVMWIQIEVRDGWKKESVFSTTKKEGREREGERGGGGMNVEVLNWSISAFNEFV